MSGNHCADPNSEPCQRVSPRSGSQQPLTLLHPNHNLIRSGIITLISIIIAQATLESWAHNVTRESRAGHFSSILRSKRNQASSKSPRQRSHR